MIHKIDGETPLRKLPGKGESSFALALCFEGLGDEPARRGEL